MRVIESVQLKGFKLPGTVAVALCCCALGVAANPTTPSDATVGVRAMLKPAARDPFLLPTPVPVVVQAPAPVFAPPPVQAAPVMPSEPVLQLSFTGRMQTPDGRHLVLAQWSDGRPVTLEQGKVLPNGYRVERMNANLVELLNPQTQAVVQLPLPPAPRFETR